jgi:hypothetical protein
MIDDITVRMRACNMLRARAISVGACPPERKNVMPSRFLILSPVRLPA